MTGDHGNEWDDVAGSWDEDAAPRMYASAAFASLQEVLHDVGMELDGARVVDFGCGTGLLTERLVADGAMVTAIDTSTAMLSVLDAKIARRGWTDTWSGPELPRGEATFDLVVCSSVCSFLDDYLGTVEKLVARLRGGGLFVQWDWEKTDDDPHGLARDEIQSVLSSVGLMDITVDTGFTLAIEDHQMAPLIGHGRKRFS